MVYKYKKHLFLVALDAYCQGLKAFSKRIVLYAVALFRFRAKARIGCSGPNLNFLPLMRYNCLSLRAVSLHNSPLYARNKSLKLTETRVKSYWVLEASDKNKRLFIGTESNVIERQIRHWIVRIKYGLWP